jgi:hypothetical protein
MLTKLKCSLLFNRDTRLSEFVGNTIRGALGRSLHDNFQNVYDAVFKVTSTESVPNPYVISVSYPSKRTYHTGETLEFSITLFGVACVYSEEITRAVELMNNDKLANTELTKAEYVYASEWSDSGAESIPYCDTLTLNFVTPTELLSKKIPIYEPDFATLTDSLFGRISAIIDNYSEVEFIIPYSLIGRKPLVEAKYEIERVKINSNNHPINGFIGKIHYYGDVTRYLPYIDLGSQLHLGKKTTRSCGEYYMEM